MKIIGQMLIIFTMTVVATGAGMNIPSSMAAASGHPPALCVTQCVGVSHQGQAASLREVLPTQQMPSTGSVFSFARVNSNTPYRLDWISMGPRSWAVDYVTLDQAFLD